MTLLWIPLTTQSWDRFSFISKRWHTLLVATLGPRTHQCYECKMRSPCVGHRWLLSPAENGMSCHNIEISNGSAYIHTHNIKAVLKGTEPAPKQGHTMHHVATDKITIACYATRYQTRAQHNHPNKKHDVHPSPRTISTRQNYSMQALQIRGKAKRNTCLKCSATRLLLTWYMTVDGSTRFGENVSPWSR